MANRRRVTTLDKLKIMTQQARCPLCGEKLGLLADTEFDHDQALCLGGADDLANLRAVHRDCHDKKTNGPGGEKRITTAGSDKHVAAKTKRLAERREAPRPVEDSPAPSFAGRPRPSGFPPAQRKGRASRPIEKWVGPSLQRGR